MILFCFVYTELWDPFLHKCQAVSMVMDR